jgi:hypothetical protein
MDNGIYNIDNKENLGHGIKGETIKDADNLENENEDKEV